MGSEILVQGGLFLLAAIIFFSLQSIPKRCLSHLRRRSSSSPQSQARRHFFAGAHLFARATASNSSNPNPKSPSLLKSAIAEADAAIALDPRDAAPHILRALALRRLGRPQPAIRSLDAALSLPQSKTLTPKERADALVQRAELHLEINRKRRAEQALADILKAIEIRNKDKDKNDGGKSYCVLGECYEVMGRREEAERAYMDALEKDDSLEKAIEGLRKLKQSAAAAE